MPDELDFDEFDESRFERLANRLKGLTGGMISSRQALTTVYDAIVVPGFLGEFVDKPVSRSSQWIAALLLAFFIPLSVNLIVTLSLVMEGILTAFGSASEALFFQFLITGLNLAFVAVAFWIWILWVSTGGFRLFEV